jgi:hypothetical protein
MLGSDSRASSRPDVLALAFLAQRLARGRVAVQWRGCGLVAGLEIGALEKRVLGEVALQLLVKLDRRQLEQPDRLLQLRRQREVLG